MSETFENAGTTEPVELRDEDSMSASDAPAPAQKTSDVTRRRFVRSTGKTVAVATPLILLFRPSAAYAGTGESGTS